MSRSNTLVEDYKEMADCLYKRGNHTPETIVQEYTIRGGFNGLGQKHVTMFKSCAGIVCAEYGMGTRKLQG